MVSGSVIYRFSTPGIPTLGLLLDWMIDLPRSTITPTSFGKESNADHPLPNSNRFHFPTHRLLWSELPGFQCGTIEMLRLHTSISNRLTFRLAKSTPAHLPISVSLSLIDIGIDIEIVVVGNPVATFYY